MSDETPIQGTVDNGPSYVLMQKSGRLASEFCHAAPQLEGPFNVTNWLLVR